jgi:hypothetical protein
MDPSMTAVAAILRIERVRQCRAICDATSRAMKRATGEPDPMD